MDTYKVYIQWGSDKSYQLHLPVTADSHQEAAEKRVALLASPERYAGLAVVGPFDVRVFDIVQPTGVQVVER